MKYFLYFFSFIFLCYGLACIFLVKKEKRIFHILAYIVPFWVWGIFFFILSIVFWHSRSVVDYPTISTILFILFFTKGVIVLFTPKRKIKKKIEVWLGLSKKKKRLLGALFLLMAFLVFLTAYGWHFPNF